MSDLTNEIRRLRRENKQLTEDLGTLKQRIKEVQRLYALLASEKAALQKRFDDFKSSADIFGGIFAKRN
jgi:predicted  nucleic acid-binding Zn-ribbon protein